MLNTQEHIDLMAHFEKAHKGHRLDRETKDQWPAGHLYQHGEVNQLFLAYRKGYALAKCIYQEPGTAEPAPQAQEETRGAPGPADIRAGLADTFRGVLREYDAKSLDENGAIEEIFGAIRDFRQPQPQPPAPASPAAPWAEYTKAPVPDLNHVYWLVWAARHMVAVCAGRDADIATVSDQAKLLGVLLAKHFANIPDVVGSKALRSPADPEAGAPGTQTPNQGET